MLSGRKHNEKWNYVYCDFYLHLKMATVPVSFIPVYLVTNDVNIPVAPGRHPDIVAILE